MTAKERFRIVAVGGTFDKFHKGHRALIMKAFEVGEHVLIGLCTDDFALKLGKNHEVAPYEDRLKELEAFLKKNNFSGRFRIIPLNDAYGPTISDEEIEAIVVSEETAARAEEINKIRRERGLKPLNIIVIRMVPAEDRISISSTRIHRGEIDREGRLILQHERKESLDS